MTRITIGEERIRMGIGDMTDECGRM